MTSTIQPCVTSKQSIKVTFSTLWKHPYEIRVLQKFPDFFTFMIPGYRPPGQDCGRAKAGLAQFTRRALKIKKERVETRSY